MVCLLLPIILINVALNVYNVVNLKRELEHSSEALFSTLSEEVEGTLTNIQINAYTLGSEIELKALNFAEESVTGKILDYWDQTKKLSYIARNNSFDVKIRVYLLDAGRSISSDGTMDFLEEEEIGEREEYGYSGTWETTYDRYNNRFLSYRYFVPGMGNGMVISMDISENSMRDMLESIKIQNSGNSFLLLEDGSVFASVGNVEEEILEQFRSLQPDDEEQRISRSDSAGNILMMQAVCGGKIRICTSFSEKKIMENSWVAASVSTIVILISALLGGLMVWLSYLILVKPIHTLVGAMKNVGNNNLNVEIPLDTEDEIGFMYSQFNSMVAKLQKLINEVYLQKIQNQEIRLSMYQAQINPHFLHNCLNFISQSAMANGDEYTARMAQFLSKYFRYNIASEDLTTTVQNELEIVTAYMEIQKIRFPGRVNYRILVDPGASERILPKLSIQPLVENSFVHALDRMSGSLFLSIEILFDGPDLRISVSDNSGIVEQSAVEALQEELDSTGDGTASLGLKNIHARVRSMYGPGSGLEIGVTEENGFRAVLVLKPQDSEADEKEEDNRS